MTTRLSLFVIALLFSCQMASAQDSSHAAFSADHGTPAIGEPIQLTLTLQVPAGSIVNMPQFPEYWPPFMVKSVGDLTQKTQGGMAIYHQTLTVILWQPGDYRTPDTTITYQPPGSAQALQITVDPAFFTVPSVLKDGDLTPRPLKPPVALPYFPLWLFPMIAVAAAAVTAAVFYIGRSRGLFAKSLVGGDIGSGFHIAAQRALRELKRIADKGNAPTEIYAQSANCLRLYLQGRFAVNAEDMTTGELKGILESQSILPDRRQRELEHLLERADLVKFARLQPKPASAQQFVAAAQRWIQIVEQAYEGEHE